MIPSILEKIKDYDSAVKMGTLKCHYENCPKCGQEVEKFRLHEYKRRIFFVITEIWVKRIVTLLLRLKCPLCKKTFMFYPPFALPYKNYVKDNVLSLCEKYICHGQLSYEKCANYEQKIISHEKLESDNHYKTFEKSTIHRWISSFSLLTKGLRKTLQLIKEKSISSEIFRQLQPIFSEKYRSDERRIILEIVQKLLITNDEFEKVFGLSIFPQFATRYWRN